MTQRKFIDFFKWCERRRKDGINSSSIAEDILAVFSAKTLYTRVGTEIRLLSWKGDRIQFNSVNGISGRKGGQDISVDAFIYSVLYAETIKIEKTEFKLYKRRKLNL